MTSLQSLHTVHVLQYLYKFPDSKSVHLVRANMDNYFLMSLQQMKVHRKDDNLALKSDLLAEAYLGECSWVESPTYVVAILDSDVSSVSNSMHGPNPANILQKQNGGVTLDSLSVGL